MNQKKWTVIQTARRLGIRVDYAYKLIWAGLLDGERVDGRWEISADSVEEYALKHSRQARTMTQDKALIAANG